MSLLGIDHKTTTRFDADLDESNFAERASNRRRIRALYRAARRATDLARVYVNERLTNDGRIAAILVEVAAYRLSIRALRASRTS